MTELYLANIPQSGNSYEWKRIVFDASDGGFRMVSENPYFTKKSDYTLEVKVPMNVFCNRVFFGNIQRLEASKSRPVYACRLMVGHHQTLSGTARLKQVTNDSCSLQLVAGKVGTLLDEEESVVYLNEINLIKSTSSGGGLIHYDYDIDMATSEIYNETTEKWASPYRLLSLVDLLRRVYEVMGYTVVRNDADREPWNCIYAVFNGNARNIAEVLPHWEVSKFIEECCCFFNLVAVTDTVNRTVKLIGAPVFFDGSEDPVVITPVDEYQTDVSKEASVKPGVTGDSNVAYSLSDSNGHLWDCLDEDVRKGVPRKHYSSFSFAKIAWQAMDSEERKNYVFTTLSEGDYATWNEGSGMVSFRKIDMFAPLDRGEDNDVTLHIVPVATALRRVTTVHEISGQQQESYEEAFVPTLADTQGCSGGYTVNGTVEEIIRGDGSVEKNEGADLIQVMFCDDVDQHFVTVNTNGYREVKRRKIGFTDWQMDDYAIGRGHWSLSLRPTNGTCLGQLHGGGTAFCLTSKHCFRFIADQIPDPTRIFLIRNKRYGCEKIEAQIDSQGMQQPMTGYFYEMID